MNTYLARFLNPSGNPDDIEEIYLDAEDSQDAEGQAVRHVDNHIFNDVELLSVELVDPGELYNESTEAI
jgi:hypothetical protein